MELASQESKTIEKPNDIKKKKVISGWDDARMRVISGLQKLGRDIPITCHGRKWDK